MAERDGADDGEGTRLQRPEQRPAADDLRALKANERVQLGRTPLRPTRLGLGTAPLAGRYRPVEEADAQAVIEAAWQAGLRFFDTAPLYGHGLAELRVGKVLRDRPRDEFVLATKVGRLLRADVPPEPGQSFRGTPALNPVFDFSYDAVMRSVEESRERMGIDRIDILHIHDPDDHYDDALRCSNRARSTSSFHCVPRRESRSSPEGCSTAASSPTPVQARTTTTRRLRSI